MSGKRFNLMVPCGVALSAGSEAELCKLCLDISISNASLTILGSEIHVFELSDFETLTREEMTCKIESKDRTLSLFFFNDSPNFKRFLYAVVDSGMCLPTKNSGQFIILPKPSFIPTGLYQVNRPGFEIVPVSLVMDHMKELDLNSLQQHNDFIRNAAAAVETFYVREARTYLSRMGHELVSKHKISSSILYKWVIQNKQKNYKSGTLQTLKQRIESEEHPEWIRKCLDTIDRDKPRTHIEGDTPDGVLRAICSDVCKASLLAGRRYIQGNMDIAAKIVSLLNGNSGLENDTKNDMFDDIAWEKKAEYVFQMYLLLTQFFDSNRVREVKTIIDVVAKEANQITDKVIPQMRPFLKLNALESFIQSGNDLGPLLARKFTECWKIWAWVFNTDNPIRTYSAIMCAITFYTMVPAIDCVYEDPAALLGRWNEVSRQVKLNHVLNFAQWLLIQSSVD